MRNFILLLFLNGILFSASFAQSTTERIYINAGNNVWEEYVTKIYLYPEFKDGTIVFKNGSYFSRFMNYNRMVGTVEFIDTVKKDTLALLDESAVNYITIGDDKFTFHPACLKTISSSDKVKLFKYEKMHFGDKQKVGAFGIPNGASSIETVPQIDNAQKSFVLDMNQTLMLFNVTSYYIQSGNSELILASKKNILSLFPGNDTVKQFIKSKSINFNKEKDLVELANYLSQL
jgi:hypothetical protein